MVKRKLCINDKFRKEIFLYGINYTHIIQEMYQKDEIELIKSEWYDKFKLEHPEFYPLNLKDTDLWITYENCADVSIEYNKNGVIITNVRIFHGDNMDGRRKDLKWSAKFKLKSEQLSSFKDEINYKFSTHLEHLYDKELLKKKKKRMGEIGREILKNYGEN